MEWEVEVDSWNADNAHDSTTSVDALASSLKLPMSGYRLNSKGGVYNKKGSYGSYWSASVSGGFGRNLSFDSSAVHPKYSSGRAYGYSVRCKRD